MDRREELSHPGSSPYYMQRNMSGSGPGVQGSLGPRSITNMINMSYQSNINPDTYVSSLPPESHSLSSERVNVVPPQAEVVVKRRRGRPRKYGPDGGGGGGGGVVVPLRLTPGSPTGPTVSGRRGRGRPPGSGPKQRLASSGDWQSGSAGTSFTPHVITIADGEDITAKITSFSQKSLRGICVLSASGAVSTVTLEQPSTSGGTVTYEGRFDILCMSGSYLMSESGGPHSRTGGLSVSLSSPNGRVVGGVVGGALIAAGLVQVIVGSFLLGNSKTKNKAKESPKGDEGLDRETGGDDPVDPSGFAPNQSLSPPSSFGLWHGSQSIDMQNTQIGIDLMRD